jgi:hypothetical protein
MHGEKKKGKVLPGERGHLARYNLYPARGIDDYNTTTVKSRQETLVKRTPGPEFAAPAPGDGE